MCENHRQVYTAQRNLLGVKNSKPKSFRQIEMNSKETKLGTFSYFCFLISTFKIEWEAVAMPCLLIWKQIP